MLSTTFSLSASWNKIYILNLKHSLHNMHKAKYTNNQITKYLTLQEGSTHTQYVSIIIIKTSFKPNV